MLVQVWSVATLIKLCSRLACNRYLEIAEIPISQLIPTDIQLTELPEMVFEELFQSLQQSKLDQETQIALGERLITFEGDPRELLKPSAEKLAWKTKTHIEKAPAKLAPRGQLLLVIKLVEIAFVTLTIQNEIKKADEFAGVPSEIIQEILDSIKQDLFTEDS